MNAMTRPAKAPPQAQINHMLEVIGRSSDVAWLATCRDHNRGIRNEVVALAAQARLTELSSAEPRVAAESKVRMTAIEQARAIWVVLATRATDAASTTPAKITYGDLAIAIGYPEKGAARAVKTALTLIGWYCAKHNLPALHALVVNHGTMEASDLVLPDGHTANSERTRVLAYNWRAIQPPGAVELQAIRTAKTREAATATAAAAAAAAA
jgi:hypothetical protein